MINLPENTKPRDINAFIEFAKKASYRAPRTERALNDRYNRVYSTTSTKGFTKEEINDILASGNPTLIRQLSLYFARFSGIYDRIIAYMATLLTYNYIVIPQYNLDNAPKNLKNTYNKNCRFLKSMNLEMLLPKINKVILREGIYYGFMKVGEKDQPIFY